MSSFLKVDIRLIIDDGRNSNQKIFFNLRDIDDDLESLYQTRAKEWFPFSLTMKVPGLDLPQIVQVFCLLLFAHYSSGNVLDPKMILNTEMIAKSTSESIAQDAATFPRPVSVTPCACTKFCGRLILRMGFFVCLARMIFVIGKDWFLAGD